METNNNKISGYLEKKSRRKMIGCYKKYWFVLEGGLLLYYRSKADYETISPFKGSINLGPPCKIKPSASSTGVFQIQTRLVVVTLRAENREEQNRWMQALMSEINPTKKQHRMSHFRYSVDDLHEAGRLEAEKKAPKEGETANVPTAAGNIIQRLQKIGAQSCMLQGTTNHLAAIKKVVEHKDNEQNNADTNHSDHIYQMLTTERQTELTDEVRSSNKAMTLPCKVTGNAQNDIRIRSLIDTVRPTTYILENDTYAVSICQKPNGSQTKPLPSNENSCIVENDQYIGVESGKDQNENELVTQENCYSEISEVVETTSDRPHDFPIYAQPGDCKEAEKEEKSLVRKKKTKDKNCPKLVKRPSFFRRVLKRKDKNKAKEIDPDDIYETVPAIAVEKLTVVNDDSAVKVLTELHNILENKMPFIMRQISKDVGSPSYSSKSESSSDYKPEININNSYCDNSIGVDYQSILSKYRQNETSHHDCPSKFKLLPPPPPKKTKKKNCQDDNVKSIDEILQDLDEQQTDSSNNNKVRRLVKHFSHPEDIELEDVVLRGARKDCYSDEFEADELSMLLEQLAKVANAPVLKPGVTTSLDVSNLGDLELKHLLPGRRRRFSEPDYDVPRPHKSLTIIPRTENTSEAVIGSTRFFGPILKQSDIAAINNFGASSNDPVRMVSMTPDSLEASPIPQLKKEHRACKEDYTSHLYCTFVDLKTFNGSRPTEIQEEGGFNVENDLYGVFDMTGKIREVNVQDSEEFVDSLEVCRNEVSTGF